MPKVGDESVIDGVWSQYRTGGSGVTWYAKTDGPFAASLFLNGTHYKLQSTGNGRYKYESTSESTFDGTDTTQYILSGERGKKYWYIKATDGDGEVDYDGRPDDGDHHGNNGRTRPVNRDYKSALTRLNRIRPNITVGDFIKQANEAIDDQMSNWKTMPADPRSELMAVLDDKNLQIADSQKPFLEALIHVRTLATEDIRGLLDPEMNPVWPNPIEMILIVIDMSPINICVHLLKKTSQRLTYSLTGDKPIDSSKSVIRMLSTQLKIPRRHFPIKIPRKKMRQEGKPPDSWLITSIF